MTTPTDPIPEFRLGADRYARREPAAARESDKQGLDSETREVVDTFEALYAELSSSVPGAAATPAIEADPDDDLQIDLPEEFESSTPEPRAVEHRTPHPARQRVPGAPAPAPVQSGVVEADAALDIDDAFAILRAAESKGRANAARDAVDSEETENDTVALQSVERSTRRQNSQSSYDVTAFPGWTDRARASWPKVAAAAGLALVIGTGLGYLAGRTPAPVASQVKIPVTPQGGAQLQFDYELRQK